MKNNIIFLKLGGSLITDKSKPFTAKFDVIDRLSKEIVSAVNHDPSIKLIIGHGSGSFGHVAGNKYHTRNGVHTREEWIGFAEVWKEARQLNQIILSSLAEAGLPIISFPPSASIISQNGKVLSWDTQPIVNALEHELIPVIYGDVIFDNEIGGTILSTEELFFFLNGRFHPQKILIAGKEEGVWENYPEREHLIREITTHTCEKVFPHIGHSRDVDVTGGMINKVSTMLDLIKINTYLEVLIFSGEIHGNVNMALSGDSPGTKLSFQ